MKNQDDREFIGRIQKAWGRPELSPAEAARFDRVLRERLEGRKRVHWIPLAALAAAAAAIALVIIVPGQHQTPGEDLSLVEVLGQAQELAYGSSLSWEETTSEKEETSTGWPGDYNPEAALNTFLNDEYQALAFLVAPPES
jgi:ferric-dicitrate binding protein FerR (iron transport regulator)